MLIRIRHDDVRQFFPLQLYKKKNKPNKKAQL